ncbi:MAG: ectoine synthase [Gammaproteobacteria bacterium]|nr:MAG: ectoine synthase [Gammaproteobacteria bacterium]
MFTRKLSEAENSARKVQGENWHSVRLLLEGDGMGFSFHITTLYAGKETLIWYKNHYEAVYCISGEGEVETTDDGKIWKIEPGTMYALDKNDRHLLRPKTEMVVACVFNPALKGNETHDEEGAYGLEADVIE